MRESRKGLPVDGGQHRPGFAGKITPLKLSKDRQRAESIKDVVDAFLRLRSSVSRFVLMLARAQGDETLADATLPQSFPALLSLLARYAEGADFGRPADLKRVIERARLAEAHRDIIFSPSSVTRGAELRQAATALERVDAALIGLCVEHVMECQSRAVPALASAGHAGLV